MKKHILDLAESRRVRVMVICDKIGNVADLDRDAWRRKVPIVGRILVVSSLKAGDRGITVRVGLWDWTHVEDTKFQQASATHGDLDAAMEGMTFAGKKLSGNWRAEIDNMGYTVWEVL